MSQTTTCRACGASLASDQRYCLACGARVASPRLDFVAELEAAEAAPATTSAAPASASAAAGAPAAPGGGPAPSPAPSRLDRVGGPMGAAAVVLVALGVGFLIGQGGNDAPTVTQPAPVVNVQGTGDGTAAPAADGAADPGTTDGSSGRAADGSGRARSAGGRRAAAEDARRVLDSLRDIPKSDGSENTGGDINRLRALPDETATPGAPPPRDDRAAGGGTEAFEIG